LAVGTGGTISLNVLENDVAEVGNVSLGLVSQPFSGAVSLSADGALVFAKEKCQAGLVEIEYEVCSIGCPDLCDTAAVNITIEVDENEGCDEVPNGITPNGDGVNDELVFNQLLNNPEDYPDNEIIIFNRWGDVVFKAKPYLNDWRGTNQGGEDLPHGTYYYILRLDIANGDIIRGDVTILK
jgi:gliding motility-associated-like protein